MIFKKKVNEDYGFCVHIKTFSEFDRIIECSKIHNLFNSYYDFIICIDYYENEFIIPKTNILYVMHFNKPNREKYEGNEK